MVTDNAVTVVPEEILTSPRSWAEKSSPKLIHYSKHDKRGHFAAWEQSELLVGDLRAAFKSLS